jgi:glycosyltransferase involved in cell wall biosynthesis
MTSPSFVSVILTSYNHQDFISKSIESVLNQTFVNFELIIIDDFSSDKSWQIINSYSDTRIKKYRNFENQGPVYGINKAIFEIAKGEYIAIHHSDDAWEVNKLDEQVKMIANNPDLGAVFTWLQVIDECGKNRNDNWTHVPNKNSSEWLNEIFLLNNHLGHPSMLIRKECYEKTGYYKQNLTQTPDVEFYTKLLFEYDIHVIPRMLTKHRIFSNASNVSAKRKDSVLRTLNEWNLVRENYLRIDNFNSLVAIFPSLKKFQNPYFFNAKFLLALVCINECVDDEAKVLGIRWLLESFNDPDQANKIIKYYSFTYNDLVAQTGKFGLTNSHERDAAFSERDTAFSERDTAFSERDRLITELDLIRNSASWKLTLPLRWLKRYIFNIK